MATLMFQRDASSSSSSSQDEEDFFIHACAVVLLKRRKIKRHVRARSCRSKKPTLGAYDQLLQELSRENAKDMNMKRFLRMTHENFQELLQLVGPDIRKEDTVMRKAIEPGEQLAITLLFLGSGDSFVSLSYLFRMADNAISQIVLETCAAIYRKLKDKYLDVPTSSKEWETIASEFENRWQFPNCIGALDGKHVQIISPGREPSYLNHQHHHSIILMVLVDASYKVIWFSAGCKKSAGDAGVFRESSLAKSIDDNSLDLPQPKPLPGRNDPIPFFIVGDDLFGLKPYLMKSFPQQHIAAAGRKKDPGEIERKKRRIFNFRLARARRVSENVFGILAARFGVFQRPMRLSPEHAATITSGCLALHNFLMRKQDQQYAPPSLVDRENPVTREELHGEWRNTPNCFQPLHQQAGNRNASNARSVRDEIKEYVNAEGQVPWQEQCVFGSPLTQ